MTEIQISLLRPAADGTTEGVAGYLEAVPTRARNVGDDLILPKPFRVRLGYLDAVTEEWVDDGSATVTVAPTVDGVWAWKFYGKGLPTWWKAVPDVESVAFTALVNVAPASLDPAVEPEAAWYTVLDATVEAAVAAYLIENPPPVTSVDGKTGAVSLSDTYVAQADLAVTPGASVEGSNTGDQDLSGLLTTAAAPEVIRDTIGTALVAGDNVTITPDDGADTITIAATSGGLTIPAIGTFIGAVGATSRTVYPNAGYGMGYHFPIGPVTVASVALRVSQAGAAGEKVRMAVYGSDPTTGLPTGSPVAEGELAVDSTGYKSLTINSAIPGGMVWVFTAALANSQTVRFFSLESTYDGRLFGAATGYRVTLSGGTYPSSPALLPLSFEGFTFPGFAILF